MPTRAVFDCMLFLQAVTNDKRPAFECFNLAEQGRVVFFLSPSIVAEVEDVLNRPILRGKFPILTPQRVEAFVAKFKAVAILTPDPPSAFLLPRDPKDQPYTDLAIAVSAEYLVTWNERHLSYLMKEDTPEGKDFRNRFPTITILPPPEFLRLLRANP
jgi:putative PIN family toxin of toxin-antitoxin system